MTRTRKIIYWIATLWLALGMTATGIVQVFRLKDDAILQVTHLGYPVYLLTILGVWKLLGVVAVLVPGFTRLKEWAYAGFFFAMTGAAISHIIAGDTLGEIFPSVLLLVLTLVSWHFRPESRRLAA
jgi:uncharacterized membrane protein YphA (DoxX/SURF4 family)